MYVKNGYARNFLIPQKILPEAEASVANKKQLDERMKVQSKKNSYTCRINNVISIAERSPLQR